MFFDEKKLEEQRKYKEKLRELGREDEKESEANNKNVIGKLHIGHADGAISLNLKTNIVEFADAISGGTIVINKDTETNENGNIVINYENA